MKNISKLSSLAAACLLILSSCNSSDEVDPNVTLTMPVSYACISTTYGVEYDADLSVSVTLNMKSSIGSIEIKNLNVSTQAYPTIKLDSLKMDLTNDYVTLTASQLRAKIEGYGITPVFSNLRFRLNDRFDLGYALTGNQNMYAPSLAFSFDMDGMKVVGSTLQQIMGGTTECKSGDSSFKSKKSLYNLVLNLATNKAELQIVNAQFAENMPGMTMNFPGIPFVIWSDGSIKFECQSLIPTINGTPYETYPISDLKGQCLPSDGVMGIDFVCTVSNPRVSPEPTVYNVTAKLSYIDYSEAIYQ